jgi:hypothetical protein
VEPITFSIVSGILYLAYDRYQKRKAAGPAVPSALKSGSQGDAALESFTLPVIGAAETETFTSVIGGSRQFDRAASQGLPFFLQTRAAVPISSGPLAEAAPAARVFRVMPLAPGAIPASEVVKQAHAAGQVVLGTLTLIGLPSGRLDPMLLVVGGPELRAFVAAGPGQRSDFAILAPPPAPPVIVPAPPAPAPLPEIKPAEPTEIKVVAEVQGVPATKEKKAKANGMKDEPTPPAVIVTEGEVKA